MQVNAITIISKKQTQFVFPGHIGKLVETGNGTTFEKNSHDLRKKARKVIFIPIIRKLTKYTLAKNAALPSFLAYYRTLMKTLHYRLGLTYCDKKVKPR
jgi:hypothetical protein